MNTKPITYKNQKGIVSIMVTIIMALVLALIVLAFYRVSQREQRQAVDRQLSTQAFYAAEAGVNDAIDYFENNPPLIADKTNCDPLSGYSSQVGTSGASYTCLLIDPTPTSLEYSSIERGESKVVPIRREDGANINTMQLYWQDSDGNSSFSGCPTGVTNTFPGTWSGSCGPGMIKIDIVPFPVAGATSRATMVAQTMSAFVIPLGSGSVGASTSYSVGTRGFPGQANIAGGACSTALSPTYPKHCRLTISGLGGQRFYLRITPIYKNAAVTICSPNCSSVSAVELSEAQAIVDSTGKATDVLRRIQVRVPMSNLSINTFPVNALESGDTICKRYSIYPSAAGPIVSPDPIAGCAVP